MGSKKRHFINNDKEKNSYKNKNQYELEFFQFVEDKQEKKDNFQEDNINVNFWLIFILKVHMYSVYNIFVLFVLFHR